MKIPTKRKLIVFGMLFLALLSFAIVALFSYAASREESYELTDTEAAGGTKCDIIVAKDGSGEHKTISAGVTASKTGQTICVKPGVYHEVVKLNKVGITLTAFDQKNRPIIDGDTDGSGNGFFELPIGDTVPLGGGRAFNWEQLVEITQKDITFSYFVVRNSKGDDVSIHSKGAPLTNIHVHHNLLQHAMLTNIGIFGNVGGSGDLKGTIVEKNVMEHSSQYPQYGSTNWPGSVCIGGGNDFTFRQNVVRYSGGDGILVDCNWKKSKNVIIEGNILYDTKVGSMYIHASDGTIVRNNFIFGTAASPYKKNKNEPQWSGINFQAQETESNRRTGTYGITGAKVYNNIIWGCRVSLGIHAQAPGSYLRDIDIYNNTFVNGGSSGGKTPSKGQFVDVSIQTKSSGMQGSAESVRVNNNLFAHSYNESQVSVATVGSNQGVTFANNYWAKLPQDVNSSGELGAGNPMLKGKSGNGDIPPFTHQPTIDEILEVLTWFEIKQGSPVIDKSKGNLQLAIDFNGFTRKKPNDVGALEFGSVPTEGWEYVDDPGPAPVCGNGKVESGEECDDGNKVDSDGCTNECKIAKSAGKCGDGNIDPGEECDDGNQVDTDLCSNECKSRSKPGPSKSPDLNKDEIVDILDISLMLSKWAEEVPEDAKEDLNNDGVIDILDISLLLQEWGD